MPKIKKVSEGLQQKLLGYGHLAVPRSTIKDSEFVLDDFGLLDAVDENSPVELPLAVDLSVSEALSQAIAQHQPTVARIWAVADWAYPVLPEHDAPTDPGFYAYDKAEGWLSVEAWPEQLYIMDTETVELKLAPEAHDIWVPTCAVGYGEDKKWYLWVTDFNRLPSTVGLPANSIYIGYNIPYDRQYVRCEYGMKATGNRFFDLMAAHIATRGQTNQQRLVYKAAVKDPYLAAALAWFDETSTNGLDAVYKLHTGKTVDKGVRDQIVDLGLPWVRDNMREVIKYCLMDVAVTADLATYLIPELKEHQPSLVSWVGQLHLGSVWAPLSPERYNGYYYKADTLTRETLSYCDDAVRGIAIALVKEHLPRLASMVEMLKGLPRTSKAGALALQVQEFTSGLPLQLRSLDWTPATTGKNKGVPAWYRKGEIKLKSQIAPLLLGMEWLGHPVLWGPQPFENDEGAEFYQECYYTELNGPLPHPEIRGKRVTSLFAKGFVTHADTGALGGHEEVKDLISKAMSAVNWVSLRKRVAKIHTENFEGYPVALPAITVTGTITRRCADPLWQVMSNPKAKRIGTELKTMIQAPEGYCIFGADVDSEELWLASAMGDSTVGFCGATPLGLMTLIGVKEQGTDVHSVVAQQLGITRDLAKNLVYAAIYGLGVQGAYNYLMKSLPNLSSAECLSLAKAFVLKFKGYKSEISGKYVGGLASAFFNYAEAVVGTKQPETPVLSAKLSRALSKARDFKTTKVNWVVQSSGSDYRDLMLTLTLWLFDYHGLDARLLMTIHDEFRFVVAEQHKMQAASCLQTAHIMTRAYIIDRLGLDCIPSGIAYHSEVDFDHVLRKSVKDGSSTPSQPEALPPGLSLTPTELLKTLSAA